jgi:Cu-processing system permease protein
MSGVTRRILQYQLRDVGRSRWIVAYFGFFLLSSEGLLRFAGVDSKALLGLTNIVLLIVPFVSMVFTMMYVYSSREFIEVMLAQPVKRIQIYVGVLLGMCIPLVLAVVAGLGLPLAIHAEGEAAFASRGAILIASAAMLTVVTAVAAVWIAFAVADRLRGLAIGIAVWLFLSVVYDGLILAVITGLSDYPLDRAVLTLSFLNPLDLIRLLVLLQFDVAALMSYTGVLMSEFFSGASGVISIVGALLFWTVVPGWMGFRAFRSRDF